MIYDNSKLCFSFMNKLSIWSLEEREQQQNISSPKELENFPTGHFLGFIHKQSINNSDNKRVQEMLSSNEKLGED